jgi:hypothetical protein
MSSNCGEPVPGEQLLSKQKYLGSSGLRNERMNGLKPRIRIEVCVKVQGERGRFTCHWRV